MRFDRLACGDWFQLPDDDHLYLVSSHDGDRAMKFNSKGLFLTIVRIPQDKEVRFLGKYISSAFEIGGHDRQPPRGAKGRFLPGGPKVSGDGRSDRKRK